MKTYRVDGTFLAQDIDDAMEWLGIHYMALSHYAEVPIDEETRSCSLNVVEVDTQAHRPGAPDVKE